MTNQVRELGVAIPAHRDGPRARSLVAGLLMAANQCSIPVTIVVGDNGANDDLAGALSDEVRVKVVPVPKRGPGYARSEAARTLVETWRSHRGNLDDVWIISLDADSAVAPSFLAEWVDSITGSSAHILSGPLYLKPLLGDPPLPGEVDAASHFLWSTAGFLEQFTGIVNLGGSNHAMRASICEANDYYVQSIELDNGREAIVPGDDWDTGARARMHGFSIEHVESPVCRASVRRIVSDPAGFLAGRTYEKEFLPVDERVAPTTWPPPEDWGQMADKGRTRVVSHFLIKGVVAGLPVADSLRWFLGEALWDELRAVPTLPLADFPNWQAYRTELIRRIFAPDLVDLARRINHRLLGV
jgi:hypothetical protein